MSAAASSLAPGALRAGGQTDSILNDHRGEMLLEKAKQYGGGI